MWPSLCIVPITSPMSSGTHSLSTGMWYQPNAFFFVFFVFFVFFYTRLVSLMEPNHVLVWLLDLQITFKPAVPSIHFFFFFLLGSEEHSEHFLWRCGMNVVLSRGRSCRQLTPESLPPFCVPPTQCIPPFVQNSSFIPPFLPVFLLFLLLCHAISPLSPSLPLTSSSLCNVILFLKESPRSLIFSHSFYNFSPVSLFCSSLISFILSVKFPSSCLFFFSPSTLFYRPL